jgi:hypothetical protein
LSAKELKKRKPILLNIRITEKKGTNFTEVTLVRMEIVKVDLIFRISTSLPVWC